MTSADPVNKDRLLFTQYNDPIYLRCLICTALNSFLGHCKIFKNFPSLWWHIKREHPDLTPAEREEIILILNHVFKAFQGQMFPKWAYSEAITPNKVPTTSSSILFNGRPPRIDVFERLVALARLYKVQTDFPNLTLKQIQRWSLVILKNVDARTQKKYVDCVRKYSKKDIVKGEYDVTGFCNTVGV